MTFEKLFHFTESDYKQAQFPNSLSQNIRKPERLEIVKITEEEYKEEKNMQDLKTFKCSVKSLEKGLSEYNKNPNDLSRDGCIQRFKCSYELSYKMIKNYLEKNDSLEFKEIIREAINKKLISENFEKWLQYQSCQKKTNHNYDQENSKDIFKIIPDFLSESCFLIKQLT